MKHCTGNPCRTNYGMLGRPVLVARRLLPQQAATRMANSLENMIIPVAQCVELTYVVQRLVVPSLCTCAV
jgi:hypothetical protein